MRITRRCPWLVALLLLSGSAPACDPGSEVAEYPGLIRDSVYVAVMAELMFLEVAPPDVDSAQDREMALDSLRSGILSAHGVTSEQVLDFARTLGSEAGRMEALWQVVTQRYDSMRIARLQPEAGASGGGEAPGTMEETIAGTPGASSRDTTRSESTRQAADSTDSAGELRRPGLRPGRRPPVRPPASRDTADGST